jgi:opacity protein-like surface antigen
MLRILVAAAALVLVTSAPAFADATLFLGSTTTPANRPAKGVAFGVGLLVIGFEFEFADTSEAIEEPAPSLRTGMGNVLLQTPFPVAGMQFYLTTGAGLYRERFGTQQETHAGFNTGGGAKISLLGPLRVRLDYRVFKLRGEPLHSTVQRVYAGLNLAF